MNIIDFLNAVKEPDGYLERGYTRREIEDLINPPVKYEEEALIDKLFYYAKAKVDPSDDVRKVKERFERECNDPWCMYTVLVPMQKDHYIRCSCGYILREAFWERAWSRYHERGVETLHSLDYWYQKTRW